MPQLGYQATNKDMVPLLFLAKFKKSFVKIVFVITQNKNYQRYLKVLGVHGWNWGHERLFMPKEAARAGV